MSQYYVNTIAQSNGDHEVHTAACKHLPVSRRYLGVYVDCHQAVREAKKIFPQSNGCYWCCRECHTG